MTASGPHEELLGRAFDRALLRRLLGVVWPHRRLGWIALAVLPVAAAFELAGPYLMKVAIDEHIAVGRLAGLDLIGFLYLGTLVGQWGLAYAHLALTQLMGQRAMNDLRVSVYRHALRLSSAFFDRTPVGKLLTRMTGDIESLNEMFTAGIVSLAADALKLAFILVVIFTIDARLALFSMASAPVLFAIAAAFRKVVRESFRQIRTQLGRLNGFLQERLGAMKIIQAFARERENAAAFGVINEGYRKAAARNIGADAALYAIVEAVGSVAMAALLWHGGQRIAGGTLTFGVLVAFVEYLGKFFAPIRDLSTKYTVMQQAMAAAERVFDLLDTRDLDPALAVAAGHPSKRGGGRGTPAVEVSHVSFAYKAGENVLRDVSLRVGAGETVAVVGATGSGKSTIIRLLGRLYEAESGDIRILGRDVREIPGAELRRRLVVVSQDVWFSAGTVRDNLRLGDDTLDDGRLRQALTRVGAADLVASRPGGLDAPVAERGANFSLGERQLLAFARALARDPEVLILDEATASVDPEMERLITLGTAELLRGRTCLIIAHRLGTVERADRIVVLHEGRVVEEGPHAELLARGGRYAGLYHVYRRGVVRA